MSYNEQALGMVAEWRLRKQASLFRGARRAGAAVAPRPPQGAAAAASRVAPPNVPAPAAGASGSSNVAKGLGEGFGAAIKDYSSKHVFAPALVAAGAGISSMLRRNRSLSRRAKDFGSEMFGHGSPGRKALSFGAGAAALGLGIEGAATLHSAVADPLRRRVYMNNMLAENPHLKKEDKKDVTKAFSTLYRFNPKMASDPLVSGSFIRRALQFREEGVQPIDVKTLVDAHPKTKSQSRFSSILPASAAELASFATSAG